MRLRVAAVILALAFGDDRKRAASFIADGVVHTPRGQHDMDLGLKGRIALVAASSRGLGRAVAEELAAEGCDLVMCARGKEALEEAAASIRATSTRKILALPADLSKPEDVSQLSATAMKEFGRVDILVTNGGGPPAGPF